MALPTIDIVGGGFGGLAAARALRNAPADVLLSPAILCLAHSAISTKATWPL
jgi:NADH dehydrogenase FAD-containing subunit